MPPPHLAFSPANFDFRLLVKAERAIGNDLHAVHERKRYPYKLMMTPYEKLKSFPNAEQFLKKDITFERLDAQAHAMSDNDAAQRLNTARATLFKTIFNRSKSAA